MEPWGTPQVSVSFLDIQWNPSGEANREVSLKFQNLVHFHAAFCANHVYFTPMTGHLFWKAFIEGFHSIIIVCDILSSVRQVTTEPRECHTTNATFFSNFARLWSTVSEDLEYSKIWLYCILHGPALPLFYQPTVSMQYEYTFSSEIQMGIRTEDCCC